MPRKSNEDKSRFLGMKHGTAEHRLRKLVLFRLVQQTGNDICFRCGDRIESPESLSIEHKRPWLGVDKSLFWDLDNIAFSHLGCNSRAARRAHKKEGPPRTAWCSLCKSFLPVEEFHKGKGHKGTYFSCKKCKKSTYHGRTGKRRAAERNRS